MRIIGITGKKRAGKNTLAGIFKALAEKAGDEVKLAGYADKVKIAGARSLGYDRTDSELIDLMDQFKEDAAIHISYTEDGAERGTVHELTGREFLQFFGTEACREVFGEDFWVDQLTPKEGIEDLHGPLDYLIVYDVRFENEAASVQGHGGVVVSVERPSVAGPDCHSSEQPLEAGWIDYVVLNNGEPDDMIPAAEYILGNV